MCSEMENKGYHAAAYLRLSRDDADMAEGRKTESNSIGAQRELILHYVKRQENIEIYDFYADDGYSGIHFAEVR